MHQPRKYSYDIPIAKDKPHNEYPCLKLKSTLLPLQYLPLFHLKVVHNSCFIYLRSLNKITYTESTPSKQTYLLTYVYYPIHAYS